MLDLIFHLIFFSEHLQIFRLRFWQFCDKKTKIHHSTPEMVGCMGRARPLSIVPDLVWKFLGNYPKYSSIFSVTRS